MSKAPQDLWVIPEPIPSRVDGGVCIVAFQNLLTARRYVQNKRDVLPFYWAKIPPSPIHFSVTPPNVRELSLIARGAPRSFWGVIDFNYGSWHDAQPYEEVNLIACNTREQARNTFRSLQGSIDILPPVRYFQRA